MTNQNTTTTQHNGFEKERETMNHYEDMPTIDFKKALGEVNVKLAAILTGIVLIAAVLTAVFVKTRVPLVGTKWSHGVSKIVFNDNGSFRYKLNTLDYTGTYTLDGNEIHLEYSVLRYLSGSADWTYAISGKEMVVTGDVALFGGDASATVTFTTEENGSPLLKIVMILGEIAGGVVVYYRLSKKKKK